MAKKGEEGPAVVVEELPRTIVRRIVKDKLSRLSSSSSSSSSHSSSSSRGKEKGTSAGGEEEGQGEGEGMIVHRDALLAFSESARIFIHYLSATANDICRESKRQIINAEDVFKALEEIEFPEFVEPLRVSLEDFRRRNAARRSGSKPKLKKLKMEGEELPAQNGEPAGEEDADEVEEDGDGGDAHDSD